ncbi:cytochrome d ubiquinol oxidase subunit II [Psittacicella hinzii]|uniref:Cytochrome d ubiquinol oxidase subunit II n=1 Tax=Psittacicella hinzii TaxID=2028575 RepID=A0A3A1YAB5_9GAMM|nr:cytochrome d ubiquinol oxidase subunit II [Psittacicella hinzii]RIY34615.1 cytochrome d ubiquinol oxidase subunit II [Psittacicella hinzii]
MLSFEVLQFIWWVLVIVLLSGFIIIDGFDLGALALNPVIAKTEEERRIVINTIAPHWDGNQVWLLLGGGAIFAAWPEVYATSFSGFYLGMVLILFALFFRPVGLEYRHKFELEKHRRAVDWSLAWSGFAPALVTGVALGNVLLGVPFEFDSIGRSFYGPGTLWILNLLKLLNPFGLLVGLLCLCVVLTQGANWVALRTDRTSELYARATKAGSVFSLAVFVLAVVTAIALAFISGYHLDKNMLILDATTDAVSRTSSWYANYTANPVLFVFPVLALVMYLASARSAKNGRNAFAFITSSCGVLLLFVTYAITLFPFILPSSIAPHQSLTIFNATSSQLTLNVMFWVAIVVVPIVLIYTVWAYYKMWTRLSTKTVTENTHALY